MNKEEFFNNLEECILLFNKYKSFNVNEKEIISLNYRSEFSLLDKNNNMKFGVYCDSVYEKFLVSNVKPGKKINMRPIGKEYIEYIFNNENFLEYVIYHYNRYKEIWKFFSDSENNRIGIKSGDSYMIIYKWITEKQSQFHRFHLETNGHFDFEYIIENSYLDEDKIECVRSQYNCKGCYVEKIRKIKNYFNEEVISNFNFSNETINSIMDILKLSDIEKREYMQELNNLKIIEANIVNINKSLLDIGLIKKSELETSESIF